MSASAGWANPPAERIPQPDDYVLERTVGNPLTPPLPKIAWKARDPQQTDLLVYSVRPPQFDESLMRGVAKRFGVKGEMAPLPAGTFGAPGYWIKDVNPTNSAKYRSIVFSIASGSFAYFSGDDGLRWDLASHRPLVQGVPSKEEAKQKALDLLPLLNLSTNDLEHYPNGRIAWGSSTPTIGYTDRTDKRRKQVVIAREITFYQRIPGGISAGIGDGGALRFSFLSNGEIASIEWFFRRLTKAGEAKGKSSKEIMTDIRRGKAWTWKQVVPKAITITNCVVAYPQGNSGLYQEFVWPFYALQGMASDGGRITLYVAPVW